MPKTATIKDVARLAGVSTTTVSHALGGQRPVSEATRTRVREAAERLGYRPHPGARSLKAAGTGVLALCLTNVTGGAVPYAEMEYYFRVVNAATQTAMDEHFAMVVVPDSDSGMFWDRLLLDGAIIVDPVTGDPNLRALRARGLPCVSVGRDPDAPDEGFWTDNDAEAATRLSLDHLAAHGARTVAAVTWMTAEYWTQASIRAYLAWCEDTDRRPRLEVVAEDTEAALREAAERVLAPETRPDAVFGIAELPALWVLRVAAERGVRVPADVMVAGTSDFGLGATTTPPMTTLDYNSDEHGREAARLLIDLVHGNIPAEPRRIIPVSLIERASTAR
jgi:DNA-binding LacI/PurR family transcriptional regulator